MGVSANLEEINSFFAISGWTDKKGWENFRKGENYRAFLATRK